MQNAEKYFQKFRKNIIGIDQTFESPYKENLKILYADWTASGRMYRIIEEKMLNEIYPLVANTHTDTSHTGMTMTYAYHQSKEIIKKHVNAGPEDVLISSNSGMTGVVNKLQRILGLKIHESFKHTISFEENERPVVFVTHMEHHSNQTSWHETLAEVVVVHPDENGLVSVKNFEEAIKKYSHRKTKIAAITSCSNVTGIFTPYMEIAALMHANGGLCFADFACSAPYIDINMHVNDEQGKYLDAIYFSPHKFLGGPGSSGILVFNKKLYKNQIPDHPGGGTVDWTNPWGEHKYVDDIEAREDGGTPAFLQTIRVAMCCKLKDEMGTSQIRIREDELIDLIWKKLSPVKNLHILAEPHKHRLSIVSFYIDGLHYNLGVKMLNDRFGIQVRGGCSCAGTYGHFLLNVDKDHSKQITDKINQGDCSSKPGWIRFSVHPTFTNEEIEFACKAISDLAANFKDWSNDYEHDLTTGNIRCKKGNSMQQMEKEMDTCLMENFC
jgi:selenocysteine lyase/cysteine desulfurase